MTDIPLWGDEIPVEWPMERTAVLSDDGNYRYVLSRRWGPGPAALFVMLNPSTADATADDPTIRRCIGFARTWGLNALIVANLYALRSTDPAALWTATEPVGPNNDRTLAKQLLLADHIGSPVIAAWGAHARADRVRHVLGLPGADRLQCLGRNKDGSPKHPLYLPADSIPTPWRPPA